MDLEIESWSEQCGLSFQEHYLYKNGKCLIDDCVNWIEIYYEEYDLDDCYYHSGGFDDYCEFQI